MRFRRFLSGLLFGAGCALFFVGLLALILPLISNSQLQLVLASFSAPSDHFAVDLINRAMRFALLYSWRVLLLGVFMAALGAWLIIHLTPRRVQTHPPIDQPQPFSAPAQPDPFLPPEPEADNPFAIGSYNDALPIHSQNKVSASVFHAAPILEKNRIEESRVEDAPAFEYEPYLSSRLEAEKRAIETETGAVSQSGSRILLRSAYERPIEDLSPSEETPPPAAEAEEEIASRAASSAMTALPAIQAPSPRIRSTMGRHNAIKRNLPTQRS